MSRFTATIHHHSIARARVEHVGDTIQQAKIRASREFGSEQQDYEIRITDRLTGKVVAWRRCGGPKWDTDSEAVAEGDAERLRRLQEAAR